MAPSGLRREEIGPCVPIVEQREVPEPPTVPQPGQKIVDLPAAVREIVLDADQGDVAAREIEALQNIELATLDVEAHIVDLPGRAGLRQETVERDRLDRVLDALLAGIRVEIARDQILDPRQLADIDLVEHDLNSIGFV